MRHSLSETIKRRATVTGSTVKSIMLPRYSRAKVALRLLEGFHRHTVTGLLQTLYLSSGTPQETADWSNPDDWIAEILEDDQMALATKIWKGSHGALNPRYLKGIHLFLTKHELIECDEDSRLCISPKGGAFISDDEIALKEIDLQEGIIELLKIVKDHSSRQAVLSLWREFLQKNTTYRSESSINSTLADRLANLEDRHLIERKRFWIGLTAGGLAYLDENIPRFGKEI